MDPREHVSLVDLQRQFNLAMRIEDRIAQAERTLKEAHNIAKQLQDRRKRLAGKSGARTTLEAVEALDRLVEQWNQLKMTKLPALNRQLTSAGLPTITVSAAPANM
jgi:hypothetical protein